jgi:uncharacterized membrane protein YphA (DoxX/SURF4 family)
MRATRFCGRECREARAIKDHMDRYEESILLIRAQVGWVFLSEGIQKFLFPGALVGGVEIIFGILVLLGWYAGWAAIPLLRVVRAFSLMQ